MADWTQPTLVDQWQDILDKLKARQIDGITMFKDPSMNTPTGAIRLERTTMILQEWDGTNWVTVVISLAGGGTGANTPEGARANLGIGTLGAQDSDDVNITGGVITGLTQLELSSHLTVESDNSFDLGSRDKQWRRGYFKSGIVIPVGIDKWVNI